eukprot:4071885-Amphidinium_carterae.1
MATCVVAASTCRLKEWLLDVQLYTARWVVVVVLMCVLWLEPMHDIRISALCQHSQKHCTDSRFTALVGPV